MYTSDFILQKYFVIRVPKSFNCLPQLFTRGPTKNQQLLCLTVMLRCQITVDYLSDVGLELIILFNTFTDTFTSDVTSLLM